MSRLDFKVETNLLDWKSPSTLDIKVIDRAILEDADVDYILSCLPLEHMARVDVDNHKPYIGIDIFYDQEASLRGVVFAFENRALAIRVPANAAKSSAKRYEEEKAAARKTANSPNRSLKGKGKPKEPVPQRSTPSTPSACLHKLLQSNLAGFGMAQISLSLWHALREKVNGVNLSSATSAPIPPPVRTLPEPPKDPKEDITESKPESKKDQPKDGSKRKSGKGDSRRQRGGRGAPKKQKDSQRNKSPEATQDKSDTKAVPPAILPDDEPLNWEREILSPGEVVKKIYPEASRNDVNRAFIGEEEAITLEGRIGEAVIRAWISSVVAEKRNSEIQNVPVVQPSRLPDKELIFFAESMVAKWKVLGETTPVRKLQLADFEDEDGMLKSNVYDTKIRAGKHQYITYDNDGAEKRLYLNRPFGPKPKHALLTENEDEKPEPPTRERNDGGGWESSRGRGRGGARGRSRQGQVREYGDDTSEFQGPSSSTTTTAPKNPLFDLPENTEVSLYGREEATRSDTERDLFILRLLEGRGSLHGPKYKDCAFIRRVWFPTQAQIDVGVTRKLKKASTAVRRKGDWLNRGWDDDTDEDEVALKKAIALEEGDEDQDDQTEDESVGTKEPTRGIELPGVINLNPSQAAVVARVVAPNPSGRTRATLVHGPPGTGKTSTIAATVVIFAGVGEPAWIVAQSNVGIKNVAEKLKKVGFDDFTLLVAQDYFTYWEERYDKLKGHFFATPRLKNPLYQKRLFDSKAVLCTLATLSSPVLEKYGVFIRLPLRHLIIDEASQIDMTSEFMHLFYKHRSTLQSVCWFGDPKQLPPFGWSEGTEIRDIFKVEHLLANSRLLNISYRLPVPIANYISRAVYGDELKSFDKHKVRVAKKALVFVDVPDGKEESGGASGKSWKNMAEAEVLLKLVETYYEKPLKQDWEEEEKTPDYAIITPYEGQRSLLAEELKKAGRKRQVYNVDSFQGNEADYIITTIAKTGGPGFLTSINRLNVLLTRCQRGLVVVSQRDFVSRAGGLLQGLWFSLEPYDPWVSAEDVLAGYVDLPGSPAPNTRPPPSPTPGQSVFPSRENMPSRPGTNSRTSAAQVVQLGMRPPAVSAPLPVSAPIKGAWGQKQGVERVKKLPGWNT